MSERGAFCTEYIYCQACFEAAKKVLLKQQDKYLYGTVIPSWETKTVELPIIAGKIGSLGGGMELVDFECELLPELERLICHPMRIAVLGERGEMIFTANPGGAAAGQEPAPAHSDS